MYRRLAVFIDFIECYAATSLAADLSILPLLKKNKVKK